ncbi:MAG TPA: zinc ribbon domain-containing protein [Solirubrobacteraceae bacterium]|nr:zinc ribbon domain-containing protein [Solirubrobacteraceae bacterium]
MLPFAYFGIESSGLNLAIDLLIVFVVVLYLSLIYWTYMDARRRIVDPMLVGCATAASLFPFVGTIVYMILRPPEYLEDVHERELEMRAAEARLHELDHALCPHCDYRIERDFIRCPSCLRKLKDRCVSCQRPLDEAWAICPYCETEVAEAAPVRRKRRRRAQAEEDSSEIGRPLIESEPSLPSTSALDGESVLGVDVAPVLADDRPEMPAGDAPDEDARATPVAAPKPASSRSRSTGSTGRARRPRPSS